MEYALSWWTQVVEYLHPNFWFWEKDTAFKYQPVTPDFEIHFSWMDFTD